MGLKLSLVTQILFAVASACTRLSMLFLARRILSSGHPRLKLWTTCSIVAIAAAPIVFIIVVVFQCRYYTSSITTPYREIYVETQPNRPIQAYWTFSFKPQRCINQNIHLLLQGIFNILSDFNVVLIPIPIVLKLKLPRGQRIMVALLFGTGFIVCLAGVVRTYYFYRATINYHDITWDAYPVWLAAGIELYLGIVRIYPTPHQLPHF